MKTYQAWIAGQLDETQCAIDAESSFEARKAIARKYRLDVTDACARRIDLGEDEKPVTLS